MCFSAGASFTAGAIIAAAGVATSLKVTNPAQRLFASVPFLFAMQQIAEGFLWIALQDADQLILRKLNTYIFLIIADVFWPVIIPLSMLLMEQDKRRKRFLGFFLYAGTLVAIYYGICLLIFRVDPVIMNCHIHYGGTFPHGLMIPAFLLYVVVTVLPLFISSVRQMYLLGVMMFIACVVSVIFYTKNVTSVWCFFAAIISILIYMILRSSKTPLNVQ